MGNWNAGLLVTLALAGTLMSRPAVLEAQAGPPPDRPAVVTSDSVLQELYRAMEPYVERARATYPAAKKRYQQGLPTGFHFAVVTRIHDEVGRMEQVFISVSDISDGEITGWISSEIGLVSGYAAGQPYTFEESELVDWVIIHLDGTEEGNFVGKFIDSLQTGR